MKKLIIFGSSGLLGQSIKAEFLKMEGYEILTPSHAELDLLDFDSVKDYFAKENPDFVLNCTGYNAVDKAEEDFEKAKDLNFNLVKNLADLCVEFASVFMTFSSDYVFDGKSREEYSEDASPAPLNKYAETKVMAENYVRENCPQFYLIRLSWLFGPGKVNFVDKIIAKANSGEQLRVVSDEFGKPTYAPDLAAELPLLIETEDYGIYHLINEGVVSWYEFAKEILEKVGIDAKIEKISASDLALPAKRPSFSALENTKWQKLRPHEEALEEYLKSE